MQQLNFGETPIETICIKPSKLMPLEVYRVCWRLAYFLELMERIDDNHVIWDENRTSILCESAADAEYYAIQNDWLEVTMELPRKFVDEQLAA